MCVQCSSSNDDSDLVMTSAELAKEAAFGAAFGLGTGFAARKTGSALLAGWP